MFESKTKINVPQVLREKSVDYKLLYYVSEGGVYNGAS